MTTYRNVGAIKPLKSSGFPKRLLFVDTETTPNQITKTVSEQVFRLGAMVYYELDNNAEISKRDIFQLFEITNFITILEYLLEDKRPIYCFGHNIGFDLRTLNAFHELDRIGFESEPPIINDRTFIWKVKREGQRIFFLDTANYAVQSVAQLGKDLGFAKMEIDSFDMPTKELMEYCIRDCEVIAKFITDYVKFLHDNKLGEFKSTLASQTLTSWRKRFMSVQVHIHNIDNVLHLEREAYHGGRVECFYIKEFTNGDFYNLDVNSMYPFIMSSKELPTKLTNIIKHPSKLFIKNRLQRSYIIAECEVTTDLPVYPKMINNRLCFPIGSFITTLHHSELKFAIEHNHIKQVISAALYDKAVIWKDYVDFFYTKRLKAKERNDNSESYFCKIALNSLYGKFGQTNVERVVYHINSDELIWRICFTNPEKQIRGQVIGWFGDVINEVRHGETAFSFPGLAGAVTAEARMLLWKYMEIAGHEETLYCDTDSLIVTKSGYNKLHSWIDSGKIGSLKLEGNSNFLHIRGNKDYSFGDKIKTKGKTKTAIDLEKDKWTQLQFEGVLAWFNRGGEGGVRTTQITKHRVWDYTKGIVDEKTGKVYPFIL